MEKRKFRVQSVKRGDIYLVGIGDFDSMKGMFFACQFEPDCNDGSAIHRLLHNTAHELLGMHESNNSLMIGNVHDEKYGIPYQTVMEAKDAVLACEIKVHNA